MSEETTIPIYYYLYHLGSRDRPLEKGRKCPLCKKNWLLESLYLTYFILNMIIVGLFQIFLGTIKEI